MTATPDAAVPRLVVVDDTDPTIQYSPASAFTLDSSGAIDWLGYGGPVYNQTVTGTTTKASLSYTFKGTFVRAVLAGVGAPSTWNCEIDGHVISAFTVPLSQITNYIACDSSDSLQGTTGEHTLTVQLIPNSTVVNGTQATLWLDSIQYQPLPSDPLDSVMLRIHNSDPSVTYGNSSGAWTYQGLDSNATDITGTSMNFAFNGSSVSLYSVDFGDPGVFNASSAYYTIDGNSSTDFAILGSLNVSSTDAFENVGNYPLFTASDLSESPHNIEIVTSYATDADNPQYLSIQYFIVKTNPAISTSPGNPTNSTSSPNSTISSSSSASSSHSDIGPLVGGIVGGIVGIVGLAALLFFYFVFIRRQKRGSTSGMIHHSTPQAEPTFQVTPFVYTPGTTSPAEFSPYSDQSQSNSDPLGSVAGQMNLEHSSGWNPNRFVTPKNPLVLQVQDEQIQRSEIRQHLDSGVRLPSAGGIVDVPPTYTDY